MQQMDDDEVLGLVREIGLGTVALAKEGHAYAIPVFYAYDGLRFYFHWHPGLKDDFIDQTAEACLVITRADAPDMWQSVQAFGPVEKVVLGEDRLKAVDALMKVPMPPAWGFGPAGGPRRSAANAYVWSLEPHRMSGRKSVPASVPADASTP